YKYSSDYILLHLFPTRRSSDLFIVTIPAPPAVGQVGFKSTTILQSQTTVTGQPIEFPLFRNQFTGILLELAPGGETGVHLHPFPDRKSTRLNSSHEWISYAVFC